MSIASGSSGEWVYFKIKNWLETSRFDLNERPSYRMLYHMLNPTDKINQALGYHQFDIYS